MKCLKLIDIVGNSNALKVASEIVKFRFGSMIHTKEHKVLNSISNSLIQKVGNKVLSGKFKFKNVRRIGIFRPSKQIFTTGNFKDKIVQQVICMILEQIFEPRFFRTSHGFRAAKGCHSALKQIQCE